MENYLGDLLIELNKRGINCGAVVHDHKRSLFSSEQVLGDEPGQYKIYRSNRIANLVYVPISPAFPIVLKCALNEFQPDLIHIHMPNPSAFWLLANKQAKRIPWLVHWHADVVSSDIDRRVSFFYKLYRPFETRLLRRATRVTVSSPPYLATSRPLKQWQDKCRVIPLGIDTGRLKSTAVQDRAGRSERFKVLAVAD